MPAQQHDYFTREEDKKRLVDRLALDQAFYELIGCAFETKLSAGGDCPPEVHEKISYLAELLSEYA